MKNYICTGKGFVKGTERNPDSFETTVIYTDKVREAQPFNTKAALKFLENRGIEGFIWKPYAQEVIRDMYVVNKRRSYEFGCDEDSENEMVEEWIVVKAFMAHESDINFLTSKSLQAQNMMTFDEAKTEALKLNMEMIRELNDKVNELAHKTEK
jgi:hypothetical protein